MLKSGIPKQRKTGFYQVIVYKPIDCQLNSGLRAENLITRLGKLNKTGFSLISAVVIYGQSINQNLAPRQLLSEKNQPREYD